MLPPLQHGIEADRTGPGKHQIEEDEAVQDCGIAHVVHRKKVLRRMSDEIGDRHRTRGDESRGSGEEPKRDQGARDKFDNAREIAGPGKCPAASRTFAEREGQELLRAMLEKKQAGHDAKDAENQRSMTL